MAVVCPSEPGPGEAKAAEEVGRRLAEAGAVVVCGGGGGAMEAVCRGAKRAGGTTVGILPGDDRSEANDFVDVAVPTGLAEGRNALVVRAADAVVAVGGAYGTLSEIALALRADIPVIGLGTWELIPPRSGARPIADPPPLRSPDRNGEADDAVSRASSPEEAVEWALWAAEGRS